MGQTNFSDFEEIEISEATRRRIASEYVEGLEAQCEGLILTLAAVYDVKANEIEEFVILHFQSIGKRLSVKEDLADQLATRRARLQLLRPTI